jgi:phosphatidylserine synthase
LGGVPTKAVDIPVCAVFMVLYIIAGALHMATFQKNKKRGKKFIFGGMMFGKAMQFLTFTSIIIADTGL